MLTFLTGTSAVSSMPVLRTSGADFGDIIGAIIARGLIGPLDMGVVCFL